MTSGGKRATANLAAAAVLVVGLASCLGSDPALRLDAYLRAVAGAEADRGWSYLGEHIQSEAYGGDQARYVADAEAADWSALRWTDPSVVQENDGAVLVEVQLESDVDSVPDFLLEKRILHGMCRGLAYGLGAITGDTLLGSTRIGGGGLSGTQMRCDAQFIGPEAYQRG
jgi:hypothetical protein